GYSFSSFGSDAAGQSDTTGFDFDPRFSLGTACQLGIFGHSRYDTPSLFCTLATQPNALLPSAAPRLQGRYAFLLETSLEHPNLSLLSPAGASRNSLLHRTSPFFDFQILGL